MSYQIQIRRDTAATWTSVNPTLAQGEWGYETDTLKFKLGDGATLWNALAYFFSGVPISSVTDTNSIDLTKTVGAISADLRLSSNAADANYFLAELAIQSASSLGLRAQVRIADSTHIGVLSTTDWATFNNKVSTTRAINTTSPLSGGGDLSVDRTIVIANAVADGATKGAATFLAADFSDDGAGLISLDYTNAQAASASLKGFLTSTDWSTFNSKVSTSRTINTTAPLTGGGDLSADRTFAITSGTLSTSTTGVTVGTGTNRLLAGNATVDVQTASGSQPGLLSSTDWTTFNNKQAAGNYITALTGDVTASGPGSVAATIAANAVTNAKLATMAAHTAKVNATGSTAVPTDVATGTVTEATSSVLTLTGWSNATLGSPTIQVIKATASVDGYLAAADFTTFNAKVSTTRAINTTSPLSGGGDLSADRTIAIANAAADGTTKGAATFAAADFNASSGLISLDYVNGQAASASVNGFLSSTDWSTFNNKVATTRTISTTSPITGGGDLSANRTIAWDFTTNNTWTGTQYINLSDTAALKVGSTPTFQVDTTNNRTGFGVAGSSAVFMSLLPNASDNNFINLTSPVSGFTSTGLIALQMQVNTSSTQDNSSGTGSLQVLKFIANSQNKFSGTSTQLNVIAGNFQTTAVGTRNCSGTFTANITAVNSVVSDSGAYSGTSANATSNMSGVTITPTFSGVINKSGKTFFLNLVGIDILGVFDHTDTPPVGTVTTTYYGTRVLPPFMASDASYGTTTMYGHYVDMTFNVASSNTGSNIYAFFVNQLSGAANNWGFYNGATSTKNLLGLNNVKTLFGTTNQLSIYHDGTDAFINPKEVGSGALKILGDLKLNTAGLGLYIKEGSNATMGSATLVLGSSTVSTTKVTASSRIFLTVESLGTITIPKTVAVTARSAGTSFTITSSDLTDTSVVAWIIIEPA